MGILLVLSKINKGTGAHSVTTFTEVCVLQIAYLDVFVVVVVDEDIDSGKVANPFEFESQFQRAKSRSIRLILPSNPFVTYRELSMSINPVI